MRSCKDGLQGDGLCMAKELCTVTPVQQAVKHDKG